MRSPRLLRGLVALAVTGAFAGMVSGCHAPAPPVLSVGATADGDSVLLANLYAAALRAAGTAAHVRTVDDPIEALGSGELAVLPGFTGRLLTAFDPGSPARSDRQVYWAMVGALPEGVAAGDYAMAASDKPVASVTKATASAWGSDELRGLVQHCAGLTAGAVAGAAVPAVVGRCVLPAAREFPDDAALFGALRAGRITVAWARSADPVLRDNGSAVALTDGKPALIRAENVVPLYRRNELTERQVLAINEVAGVLDTAALADFRERQERGVDPQAIADDWLAEHPLGR